MTDPTGSSHTQKLPVSIQDEMRTSYLDYAMSVIIGRAIPDVRDRSEEHTSELQSRFDLVCRLLLELSGHHRDLHSFPTRRSSDLSIQDEMRTSYLDYAMSVIIGRAIPDVRD